MILDPDHFIIIFGTVFPLNMKFYVG